MERTLKTLQARFPSLRYRRGTTFCWSPKANEIIYNNAAAPHAAASLLHETCHALLHHTTYGSDAELLALEVTAWESAEQLGRELGIMLDTEHIQDCLDSYRDWIYARSVCPTCQLRGLQQANLRQYKCFNCNCSWNVTPSRFCRAYRSTKHSPKMPSPAFHALH